jgi:hypothetical protein
MKKVILFIAIFGISEISKAQTVWPLSSQYVYFGNPALNQNNANNYALLQHQAGRTTLNSPDLINFRISNADKMTLDNNGNLGIGITTPKRKLHVNGDILVSSGNSITLGEVSPTSGRFQIVNASSCCYNTYVNYTGGVYFRRDGQGSSLGLLNDGNVTIGVYESFDKTYANTSGFRLMVNGGIMCEKLRVIGNVPDSDYVFEENYRLKTLEEVYDFITKNKHLPEVPSAKCFKEDGYNVGDMDDLLLRKVEEMTLYIIQMNKEIESLKLLVNKTN